MKHKRLKNYLKLGILLFGISLFLINCQTDDFDKQETQQLTPYNELRVQIKRGDEVSKRVISYLKQKTNNSLKVSISKSRISLSKGDSQARETELGTVDTSKEIIVINETNTKHTFKVEIVGQDENSITNLIVVETETELLEYFLKYNFADGIPYNEITKAVDFSQFKGTIETYSIGGELTGSITIENGTVTEEIGEVIPCPDEPVDTADDGTTDDGSSSGGSDTSGGLPGDSDPSDNDNTSGNDAGSGGGWFADSDGGCGLSWSYGNCGCGEEYADGHAITGNPCCNGSPLIVTDCNGNVLGSGRYSARIISPCDGTVGVLIDEDDDCDTSKEDLKKVFSNISDANAELLASIINDKGKDFGIDSDEDLWHFLSQAGHETGGFNTLQVTENMNYSTASYIPKSYPSKFTMDTVSNPTKKYAGNYTGNPSGLANVAMCCKYGNGNEESGDGWKYRGRGIFQLTWKDNYQAFKTWYNNKYNPDIDPVTTPNIIATNDTLAILSGLWYYKTRVEDKITIDSTTTVDKVTLKINGKAKKGLKDRKQRFNKAKDSINCL